MSKVIYCVLICVTRVLPYRLDALTTELWETGDEQGHILCSYMCDTCPDMCDTCPAILVGRSNHCDEQGHILCSYMCDTCPAIPVGRCNH